MRGFLFPGQGTQRVGMGRELYDSSPQARERFALANRLTGCNLTNIMFTGPTELLNQTDHAQVAVFLVSYELSRQEPVEGQTGFAGHSLGDYAALVAAGVLDFESALRLVIGRGRAMQKAALSFPGKMAAVIGLTPEQNSEICTQAQQATGRIIVPANCNSPQQTVISGEPAAVDWATERAKTIGGRVITLRVTGAFHSPLMESAKTEMSKLVSSIEFRDTTHRVYSSVTGQAVDRTSDWRTLLVDQITAPVKWTDVLLNMWNDQIRNFVLLGPGNVLEAFIKETLNGYRA